MVSTELQDSSDEGYERVPQPHASVETVSALAASAVEGDAPIRVRCSARTQGRNGSIALLLRSVHSCGCYCSCVDIC